MHRFSRAVCGLIFALATPCFGESPVETSTETAVAAKREESSRWDSPWDSGMLFLPPLGSLDLLYRYRFGEFGDEHFGFLTLNLPLEKLARPAFATSKDDEDDPSAAQAPKIVVNSEREVVSASREVVEPEASLTSALALARAVAELVRATAPERAELLEIEAARGRSRTSGLLPELRLRGAHGFDQSVAPSTSGVYGAPAATRGGWDTAFEVRLTFRLGRLLYDDGESSLLALRHRLRGQIEARVEESLEVLTKFQAARRRLSLEGLEDEERVKDLVLREESLARLDVLTGGKVLALIEKHLGPRALVVASDVPEAPENTEN